MILLNITTYVEILPIHLALPYHDHIDQGLNIHAYLKKHPYSRLVMNHAYMNTKNRFGKRFNEEANWFEFYGDIKEEVPANAPEALGKGVDITGYLYRVSCRGSAYSSDSYEDSHIFQLSAYLLDLQASVHHRIIQIWI